MAELSDTVSWFETDASNNKAPPNGWPEGMMPSGVNDAARSDKGALKRFWNRANPVQNVVPASGVWTFVTSNPAYPTSYVDGEVYTFKATNNSIGGDSFQVNGLGPKPIYVTHRDVDWAPVVQYDIMSGMRPRLVYDSSLNAGAGGFMLTNPYVPIWNSPSGSTIFGTLVASSLTVNGPIQSLGAGSGLYLGDQVTSQSSWVWYVNNDVARLQNLSVGDRMTVDTNGNTAVSGYVQAGGGFATVPNGSTAAYTFFDWTFPSEAWQLLAHDGIAYLATTKSGGWAIGCNYNDYSVSVQGKLSVGGSITMGGNVLNFLSSTGGPALSCDTANMSMQLGTGNGSYFWYTHAAAATLMQLNSGALTVNTGVHAAALISAGDIFAGGDNLWLAGATSGSGPRLVGDTTNMSMQLGSGNGGWYWTASGGANAMSLTSGGVLTVANAIHAFTLYTGTDLFVGGGNLWLNGATSGSGPRVSADNSSMQFQLGSGNAQWNWYTSTGTLVMSLTSGGVLNTTNAIGASAFNTAGAVTANGGFNTTGGFYTWHDQVTPSQGWQLLAHDGGCWLQTIKGNGWCIECDYNNYNVGIQTSLNVGGAATVAGTLTANNGITVNSGGAHITGGVFCDGAVINGGLTVNGTFISCQNIDAANDINSRGVFRRGPAGSGLIGARIECFAGSNSWLQFGMSAGYFQVTPDGGASGWNFQPVGTFSDARLKDNIRDTKIDALAVICATRLREFEWNERGREMVPRSPPAIACGFVAQELEETMPFAVTAGPSDMLLIEDDRLTPYIFRAIQQLEARLKTLEAKRR